MSRRRVEWLGLLVCATILTRPLHAQHTASTAGAAVALPNSAVQEGLPLQATRTVEFTAAEGSWMSVDVSPDGKTLVFDLLGDLYTMPIIGGRATPLTRGMAYDAQPRFSPDGKRVVFTSDRTGGQGVWILSLDLRDTVQLTHGKHEAYDSPEWTPDGQYVVASRQIYGGAKGLVLYHVGGGSGVPLPIVSGGGRAVGAAFSPDGSEVWLAHEDAHKLFAVDRYSLIRYNRASGAMAFFDGGAGSAFRPTLSPDGRWLVYATRYDAQTGLRLHDLRTGTERWLAYPVQRDDLESAGTLGLYPGMSFTPDSKALIAFYGGQLWQIPIDGSAPHNIPFEAPVTQYLGPAVAFDYPVDDAPTFTARQVRDLAPSPDGRRLAFVALDRLYLTELPNGTPRRVTSAAVSAEVGEHAPAWSPDGQWLTYVTWSDSAGGHVYKVRAKPGARPQRLSTAAALYEGPVFSPDGTRIVVTRSPVDVDLAGRLHHGPEFVWLPARGGAATVIAPAQNFTRPHFRRDEPERIYVHDRGRLASMRWDGTDLRDLLRVTQASLMLAAPVGDQVLIAGMQGGLGKDLDIHVTTVPPVGTRATPLALGQLPSRQLTDVLGGQFPAWSWDATRVHWSLGNAHFAYDLGSATPVTEDSVALPRITETRILVTARRDLPRGTAVLRGARLITMRGDEVIEDGELVVRNQRIIAVGRRGEVAVPADARIIDVRGTTIVPGFVDTHFHIPFEFRGHAYRPQKWAYVAHLAYGVTTTRDPSPGTMDLLAYEDRVAKGEALAPRVYSTGPNIGRAMNIRNLDHARQLLRRYSTYYDTQTLKQYAAGNREQRQWIAQAARELRLTPTTEGLYDIERGLTETIDGYAGHEHAWPSYPHYSDRLRLFAASGVVYTPTILVAYGGPAAKHHFFATENVLHDAKLARFLPHGLIADKARRRSGDVFTGWFHEDEHVIRHISKTVADLVAAGGRAAVGSHGELHGLGYHWELWAMQSGGLRELDALRCATLFGAQAIGLGGDLGSLEPGKLADLVVLEQNPLENIRNTNTVRFVMKNGRLYDGDTLAEVYPRERPAPRFSWQADAPNTRAGIKQPR